MSSPTNDMSTPAQSQQTVDSDPQADTWEKSKATFQSYVGAIPGMLHRAALTAGAMHRKRSSEYYDPCQEFANKSIKCMHRNNGDRDMCQDYFKCVSPARATNWPTRRTCSIEGNGRG